MKISLLRTLPLLISSILFGSCTELNEREIDININDYAIVYNVLVNEEKNNYEVFTMNTDGTNKQNITNLKGVEWSYSSYEDNLFFISDKDTSYRYYFLYVTDFLGNNIRKISDVRLSDSWMSFRNNGTEVIVTPHSTVDSAFYIIDLDGNLVGRIETGLKSSSDPCFVGKGDIVAFRGGTKKSKRDPAYEEEIYLINIDGSGLKKLTYYPSSDTTAPWYAYKAGPPRQHPTERFISYASYQNGKYSLFGVTLDGKKQWELTENKFMEIYHDWSSDGKWLVTDLSNHNETQFNIGLMNWETKEWKILTDTTYNYQQSPNFVKKY